MSTYAVNKKAKFDYEILDTYEAGLVLFGHEVKSIKTGNISLKGSFVTIHNDDVILSNLHIPKYKYAGSVKDYDPERPRKLLLKTKEIAQLKGKISQKGLTIVPISVYNKGRHIKIEIAVAKGKKKYDKKEIIKKREIKREIDRNIKLQN